MAHICGHIQKGSISTFVIRELYDGTINDPPQCISVDMGTYQPIRSGQSKYLEFEPHLTNIDSVQGRTFVVKKVSDNPEDCHHPT